MEGAKQYRLPRINWEIPSKFVLASDWYVVSGEDSEEKAVQKLRESAVLEALYHHSSTIPHNPFFPPDIENQYYDDRQTPLIPIIPIEEAEADASLAEVAAVIAIMKSMDPKSLIDTDLLIKIPSNPTMTTKLINKYRLTTDNISIPSESNMPESAQLSLPRMPAGDALSLPVSKQSMFLSLKEDHGGHDHAGNTHVAARTGPLMKKTKRDYGLPDNLQRNNNPATKSLLAPVHITKDYNAKTAVPMLKDHEQSPQRNIQGNLQKPEFSNKKLRKACKFINKPEGCKNGSRCLFRHETYSQQRPNKRMKLGSVADESSLHSSYHISTDASYEINKPSSSGVAVKDVDSPAADESPLHSSYHISTDASCKINKPPGWRMAIHDDDFPAADDESSLHSSYHISTDASWKINKPSGLGVSIKDGNGHLLEACPFFPPDFENQYYDDRQTPLIPIIPIEEAEADSSLAAVAAVTAIMKSMDPKSLIDTDLLMIIPSDPTMTTKLINKNRLATDNISIPSESNMQEDAQLSLPRMPAGDALSLPVSEPSMFLSLKEDHGGHDHAGNAHVAARTDPLMEKTKGLRVA